MKNLFILSVLISISMLSSASNGNDFMNSTNKVDVVDNSMEDYNINAGEAYLFKDCTVKLDFELEDGSTIQGEITFIDVSWWECTKMQFASWWYRTF